MWGANAELRQSLLVHAQGWDSENLGFATDSRVTLD